MPWGLQGIAVRRQTQLATQGRLDAQPVKDFAFNGACLHGFFAEEFNAKLVTLIDADMAHSPRDLARRDTSKGSLSIKLKRAGWSDAFLLSLLNQLANT